MAVLLFTSKSPKWGTQKPAQYGPLSAVQYAVRHNAEQMGLPVPWLYYPMFEGAGTTMLDLFGEWTGIIGGVWTPQGQLFNSTDLTRAADISQGAHPEIPITLMTDFRTGSSGTARPLNIGNVGATDTYFGVDAEVGSDVSYWFRNASNNNITATSVKPSALQKLCVIGVSESTQSHKLYVDGLLVGYSTSSYSPQGGYDSVGVGGLYRAGNILSSCEVYQCIIWDKALDARQSSDIGSTPYALIMPVPRTFFIDMGGGSSVSSTFQTKYDIRGLVNSDFQIKYDLLNSVLSSFQAKFDIFNAVQSDFESVFDVANLVSSPFEIVYDMLGNYVNSDFQAKYDIKNTVTSEFTTAYSILNAVMSDFATVYDIRQLVNGEFEVVFDIKEAISSDFAVLYDMAGRVFSEFTVRFDIKSGTIKTRGRLNLGLRLKL